MTRRRHEYRAKLPFQSATPLISHTLIGELRKPTMADSGLLSDLMFDAYQNTIDYDGETLEDAAGTVASFFAGDSGRPLLDCSWLCINHGVALSVCLVSLWQSQPLICYVMTGTEWKGRSLARRVLHQSLSSLGAKHGSEVRAFITEGNSPSERLFDSFGFAMCEDPA